MEFLPDFQYCCDLKGSTPSSYEFERESVDFVVTSLTSSQYRVDIGTEKHYKLFLQKVNLYDGTSLPPLPRNA
eukprot:2371646-Rhodomonas_salina.2